MKILHLLVSGGVGGIERLCLDISKQSKGDNFYYFLWNGGDIADMISQNTNKISINHYKNLNFFKEYVKLKNYCIINNIDVVVVQHHAIVSWIYGMLLKAKLNCKLFVYAHANANDFLRSGKFLKGALYPFIFKMAYKKSNAVVAISDSVKRSIKGIVGSDDKVEVCYNGIDVTRFSVNPDSVRDTLLFVGRLIPQKGVRNLIAAMSMIDKSVNAIIVGEGPQEEELKSFAKEIGVFDRIQFVGKQIEMNEWYSKGTIFVHPCSWEEGFGITIVEAMACGIPCVAYSKGAIPEIISDGKDGFIVKNDSVEALAEKLTFVLNKSRDEEWKIIRNNARIRAEHFSIKKMIERQEKVWEN